MLKCLVVAVLLGLALAQDPLILLHQMTMEEKYSLLEGIGWVGLNPYDNYYVGNVPAIPRLGIPSINMQDGPQGFRTYQPVQVDQVTSWPCSLAASSTWDPELVHQWARAMSAEFLAKGANVLLGPCVDIGRVPSSGRAGESLSGEEPLLGERLAVQYVRGVQDNKVMAVAKHFTAYSQETNRNFYNAIVDDRTLFEVYYGPFRAMVQEAKVGSVMCSYNRINGKYASDNPDTLKRDLKLRMEFDGFVMSDWWAAHSTATANHGLDMEMPGDHNPTNNEDDPFFTPSKLSAEVEQDRINEMVYRILNSMIRVGLFNSSVCTPPNCDNYLLGVVATNQQHQKLARQIAGASVTLLKNEKRVLPVLRSRAAKLAIIGSACDAPNPTTNLQWTDGSYYVIGGSGRVLSTRTASFLTGMRQKVAGTNIELLVDLSDDVQSSLNTIQKSSLAFICGGATSTESIDRPDLELDQSDFIQAVTSQSSAPTVAVLMTPGSVTVPFHHQTDAILNLFFGGEATGLALADVVFGDVNPSGRLSVTFPASTAATVAPCPGTGDCVYSEGLFIGYRGLKKEDVTFPFGHGLSYTTFSYSTNGTRCVPRPNEEACFYVDVRNGGDRDGHEVVQLYVRYPDAYQEPPKTLRDFQKVFVRAGGRVSVRMSIPSGGLDVWDKVSGWTRPKGQFRALIGASSEDIRLDEEFGM